MVRGQGDGDRGTVADQVLGPVLGLQDEELQVAGDGDAAEGAGAGEHRHVAADAPGELFPEHGGAELGADRGHGLLLGLRRRPASNSASSSSNTRCIVGGVDSSGSSGSCIRGRLVACPGSPTTWLVVLVGVLG